MPKYIEKPANPFSWLFLVPLLALLIWLIWSFPYLLLFNPIFFLADLRNRKKRSRHFEELLKGRENDSICTFSRHFECREIDTWVIRAVYEQLQLYLKNEKDHFPVRATDDVFQDLKIDDEDFEYDLVEEIAQRANRTLENAESNAYYGKASIVENLVFFFNQQPRKNAT